MKKRTIAIAIAFAAIVAAILLWPEGGLAALTGGKGGGTASPQPAAQASPGAGRPGSAGQAAARPGAPAQGGAPQAAQGPGGSSAPGGGALKAGAPGSPQGSPAKRREAPAFSIRTAVVQKGPIQAYIEVNGDIVMDSTVEVSPYASGRLVSLKVALGARVAPGQLIAEVDPSTPGSAYALNQVLAPIAGTVTSLPLSVGSKVSTTSIIAKLGNLDADGLQVSAKIAERYVGVLRTGLKAAVSLEAYPGVAFPATVSRVSPVVDSTSRTKEIRLSFDRPDPRVNAGMFARVKLDTVRYADRLRLPESAIVEDSTGRYAYALKDGGTVEKRRIELGVVVDGVAEIRSGLAEGDVVAVEGVAALSDGARVKVLAAEAAGR